MWKSYELPEPVQLEAGKMYMMGFEGEVPFVRPATDDERVAWRPIGQFGVAVRDHSDPQMVVPQRDMTATFLTRESYRPGLWATEELPSPGAEPFS